MPPQVLAHDSSGCRSLWSWRWTSPILFVALAVVWAVWNHDAFRATCLPAVPLSTTTRTEMASLVHRRIRVKPTQVKVLFARGYTLGKAPYSSFAMVRMGERWLVVCQRGETPQEMYDGVIEPLSPFDEDVLVPRLRERFPECRFHAVRLNTVAPWSGYFVFGVLAPILVLLLLGGVSAFLGRGEGQDIGKIK